MSREKEPRLIRRRGGVEWYDDGTVLVVRCGRCRRENWALAVASGMCCWCGWRPEPQPAPAEP